MISVVITGIRASFKSSCRFYYRTRVFIKKYNYVTVLERCMACAGPLRSLIVAYLRLKNPNPKIFQTNESLFNSINTDDIYRQLKRDGCAEGIELPSHVVNDILTFTESHPAVTYKGDFVCVSGGEEPPLPRQYIYMYPQPHVYNKTCNDIAHDPTVVDVVRKYIGAEPKLFSSRMYWSFNDHKYNKLGRFETPEREFHFDVPDTKSLSLFFYLSDVDLKSGPHTVIKGTHRNRSVFQLLHWGLPERIAYQKFKGRVKHFIGKKGSGFFEELMIYHRHTPPLIDAPRLLLTFTYVISRKESTQQQSA